MIGGTAAVLWIGVENFVFDADLMSSAAKVIPYFVCFEAGVLSRYVPGLRTIVKRLASH